MSQNFNEKQPEPQIDLTQFSQQQPATVPECPKCGEFLCSNATRTKFCPECDVNYL